MKYSPPPTDTPEADTAAGAGCMTRLVRLKDAMIAWNPMWSACPRGGEPGQVGVCKHPDNGQLNHLSMWCNPSNDIPKGPYPQKEAEHAWTMLRLMVEVWHIACRDGVPLENLHAALSAIPEYNELLSEDFKILPNGEHVHPLPARGEDELGVDIQTTIDVANTAAGSGLHDADC